MAISVSVSDQVQDGYLAAGRGIAQGIQAFAQNRTQALEALASSPDPSISGPAVERLQRTAGISQREERDFLTQSMEGLARMGAVTMQDLEKFHGANIQGQRSMFSQAVTAADLGMREAEARKENEIDFQHRKRLMEEESQHKIAGYKAYEESQRRMQDMSEERKKRETSQALEADRKAVKMLIDETYAQARKEGVTLQPFDVSRANKMSPEEANDFLIGELEEARQRKAMQGAGNVAPTIKVPGIGEIVIDPRNQERVPSSQIIQPEDGTAPPVDPGATTPTPSASPTAARDLIFRKGRAQ